MQIQRHFRFSLLLCLVPTVQLFGQAPTLTVSTPLNPGSPIQVTGTKGSSVAISSPSKDGVSCGDAGLFDLGNPLLIHEGADSPAQTLPLTGSPQSIVPSAPTSPNQTLCFRATNVAGVTYSSQKVAAPMVKIQFAVQPVGGLNAISIQGDANARVGVLELPASYKPNPKSDSCSANDLSNGQWLAIGLGDSTTGSTPLNGTPPFTIALSKPLEAGVQLCLVALETIAGAQLPTIRPSPLYWEPRPLRKVSRPLPVPLAHLRQTPRSLLQNLSLWMSIPPRIPLRAWRTILLLEPSLALSQALSRYALSTNLPRARLRTQHLGLQSPWGTDRSA